MFCFTGISPILSKRVRGLSALSRPSAVFVEGKRAFTHSPQRSRVLSRTVPKASSQQPETQPEADPLIETAKSYNGPLADQLLWLVHHFPLVWAILYFLWRQIPGVLLVYSSLLLWRLLFVGFA
ncbi:hypothetical protein WJX73_007057 [Symbiochloris irregularis]|uniref:Uncharacterized protein n=1 Tax=Symbiochloris irregularis TaxID=706552 RepID=A0AAW1PQF5_9CHLO